MEQHCDDLTYQPFRDFGKQIPLPTNELGACPYCGRCPCCGRPWGPYNYPTYPHYQPIMC